MSEEKPQNVNGKLKNLTHRGDTLRLMWSGPVWSKVIAAIIFGLLGATVTGAIDILPSPADRLVNANVAPHHYSAPTCSSATLNGHIEPNGAETLYGSNGERSPI